MTRHCRLHDGELTEELRVAVRTAVIKDFEVSFELAWKTLKDLLSNPIVPLNSPREVIREAWKSEVLVDGEAWLRMLTRRNLTVHLYGEADAQAALEAIKGEFQPLLLSLVELLQARREP